MREEERVIIFIDGSNHYHNVKNIFKSSKKMLNFNFEKFSEYLVQDKKLIKTNYYNSPLDISYNLSAYMKQQKFFEKLRKIPDFNLILCRMQKQIINEKIIYLVKEDDIHLAVDMVSLAFEDKYDTAILVSSDGDFVPAVKIVKKTGKKVKNIGFEDKFSYHLKQECTNFLNLNKQTLTKFFNQ